MRLLHFADLHLGIERYGHSDPRTGLSSRLSDFLRAFDAILDTAIDERVDAILFAGDAFKNREPTPTVQREFARRVRCVVAAGIPIVLLIGNHDLPHAWGRATSLAIYRELDIPGVHIGDSIGGVRIETRSGPLQVVTLPWVTHTHVLPREEYQNLSMTEVQERLLEAIGRLVGAQADQLDPALPAVLCAHGTLHGATFGSERSVMLGQDITLGRADLSSQAFDYVALGHIHKHQRVGDHPPAVYAGSPERIDFGEEKETKGFVMVTIGAGERGQRSVSWEFRPLETRPFVTVRLTAGGSDPVGDLERSISRLRSVAGAITRLIVTVEPEAEGKVRPADLRRWLRAAGADYVAGITLESQEDSDRVTGGALNAGEALSPLVMLDRYLAARKVPETRARQLRDLATPLVRMAEAGRAETETGPD